MSAIDAEGLTRHFGSLTALDGVDLTVPRGTVFGFLGPNGAGKTTTIRLLLGLIAPSSGRLTVLGESLPAAGIDIRRRTGVVLETHGLYDGMTVAASLEFAARTYGMSAAAATSRVQELADRFGLGDRLKSRPQTLSRGMRQRMSIARALVGKPELLVLDEPTNGLDAEAAADLRALLVELVAAGTTVFLTTHLLAEAERLCDRVTVIKSGRVIATGSPAELRSSATVTRVRVEGPDIARVTATQTPALTMAADGADAVVVDVENLAAVPTVIAAIVRAGGQIHRVEPVGQTLEAAFLALVGEEVSPLPDPPLEAVTR